MGLVALWLVKSCGPGLNPYLLYWQGILTHRATRVQICVCTGGGSLVSSLPLSLVTDTPGLAPERINPNNSCLFTSPLFYIISAFIIVKRTPELIKVWANRVTWEVGGHQHPGRPGKVSSRKDMRLKGSPLFRPEGRDGP